MNSRKLGLGAIAIVAMVLLLALVAIVPTAPQATAAPAMIPTPASVTRPANDGFITFYPFSASAITADTTSTCYDVAKYSVVDVLYVIDQTIVDTAANTTTLTALWSIDGTTTATGINVVASNAADATDMQQLQTFGRYFCLLANVSNTLPVTVTAQVIAK